ncbi:MAG: ATP-dependent DNA helicase UvrD2 [Actinomycetaceae bacterium]|nr:ATP-dependent DNA helicase UvrD2 [Actinomycetaceae bacterium]
MNEVADALLEVLDPEQAEVALQVTGPLAVLAGAGTGKTRAITYRLAYGTAVGAYDPKSVLAVTFTQRAAAEMRSRLQDLGVIGAQARTFHSAALRQLRYFWPNVIGGPMPAIMDYKAPVVAAAAGRLGVAVDKSAIRDISAEVEWAKVSMISPEKYADALKDTLREPPAGLDADTMANLLTTYESAKDERGVIDFEDVLLLMTGIMQDREDVARAVRSQYRNFVVDEFQDVSTLQFALLQEWLGGRHDVCVVGDVSQTIYSFAGADPSYLVNFEKYHPGARRVQLNRNYRSTPQIVSTANRVLEVSGVHSKRPSKFAALTGGPRMSSTRASSGMPEGAVRLKAQRDGGPAVSFVAYSHDEGEAAGIARQIKALHADGMGLENIAILYRTNVQSQAFEQALADEGIGYLVRGGTKFFERDEIRRAMVMLRQQARIEGGLSAASGQASSGNASAPGASGVRISTGGTLRASGGSGASGVSRASSAAGSREEGATEASADSEGANLASQLEDALGGALAESGYEDMSEVFEEIEVLQQQMDSLNRDLGGPGFESDTGLVEAVKDVALDLGWTIKPPAGQGAVRERWDALDALVNLAIERKHLTLPTFVKELNEREEAQAAPVVSGVTLTSLHAAKGLEWDAVFLAGVSDGLLPISLAKTPEAIEEELRLLYVGVTRAKTRLTISYAKMRGNGQGRTREYSRFLQGMWPEEYYKPAKPKHARPKSTDELAEAPEDVKRLFEALREWRLEQSRARSKPAFTIFTDRTLIALADVKPKTLTQLRMIPGIGATKAEKFGADVLAIIREHAGE